MRPLVRVTQAPTDLRATPGKRRDRRRRKQTLVREAPPQFPVDAHNGCGPTTSHRCLLTRRRVFHMMGVRPCTGAPKSAARVPPRLAARMAKSGRVPPQSEAGGVVDANAPVRVAVFVQQSVPAVYLPCRGSCLLLI